MSAQLLHAIGFETLETHFEWLDDLRDSGRVNMWGAARELERENPGMSPVEARAIATAWQSTFTETLPAADRVANALDAVA